MRLDFFILSNTNQLCPRSGLTFQAGDLTLSAMGTLCLFEIWVIRQSWGMCVIYSGCLPLKFFWEAAYFFSFSKLIVLNYFCRPGTDGTWGLFNSF